MTHPPKQDQYMKSLMQTISSIGPYRTGYMQLCEFMFISEIPLPDAQEYIETYVRKQINNLSST